MTFSSGGAAVLSDGAAVSSGGVTVGGCGRVGGTKGRGGGVVEPDADGGFLEDFFDFFAIVLVNVRASMCPSFDTDESSDDRRSSSFVLASMNRSNE